MVPAHDVAVEQPAADEATPDRLGGVVGVPGFVEFGLLNEHGQRADADFGDHQRHAEDAHGVGAVPPGGHHPVDRPGRPGDVFEVGPFVCVVGLGVENAACRGSAALSTCWTIHGNVSGR
ncbi:hypothetical protein [Jidongwangia harbinensis]|uniref:hypothetical protein n=1 Tax=Jidongwangia harbinensis TaxID=2878561 RepID=UPI001CD981DF|nr:hypothetical protein [Jidongwangia harbinensis]MCA2216335.1 hypothetical protein [Jidongwangia harbinensis]MCA2217070.1 hypothetical protein [Jidongwangia harbinensis]